MVLICCQNCFGKVLADFSGFKLKIISFMHFSITGLTFLQGLYHLCQWSHLNFETF